MNRFLPAVLAALALFLPNVAKAADWYYAESANFRLYAYDDEEDVRRFTIQLERLDQALRILTGIGPATEPPADFDKVTVFRFGETRDIGNLVGARSVGGFFIPRAGQSVAFVPRRADRVRGLGQRATGLELQPEGVLFHEYVHYFMNFHTPAAYPAWYSEGFAEIFYTIELGEDRFTIGEPPPTRAFSLGRLRVDTASMFDPEEDDRMAVARIYGHGWLLTSYLMNERSRDGQLNRYMRLLNEGRDSLEAAEEAFGDLRELDREVDRYRRSNAYLIHGSYLDESTPEVSVRRLTPAEEEIIEMVARSKVGVTEEQAQDQVPDARRAVERFPDSLPVLHAAIEVEFDAGNLDEANALAERALAIDPDSMVAALYRAEIAMRRAADDPELYLEARRRFLDANAISSDHPAPLYGYYKTFVLAGEPPTENAAIALEAAFREAPYDYGIRTALGHLLLLEERDDESFVVMTPFINNPHSRSGRRMRGWYESGDPADREKLLERLQPRPYDWERPDEWDEEDEEEDEGSED